MAFILANVASKLCVRSLEEKFVSLTLGACANQKREKHYPNRPKLRNPTWFTRKNRVLHNDCVSAENREYLQEVVQDRLKAQNESPLAAELMMAPVEWDPKMRRTGVIARKIGIYPMWLKNGKKISTTLLQVLDNHVIRYYGPEEYEPARKNSVPLRTKKACILLGAEAADPSLFTKEYCGLFRNSGVVPKKHLARFYISTEAALPLGTPLSALHYRVGQVVDVRGKTIDRGFQGVMKRHGFKGMPASHGVTKTHRRGGNIGGGGEKARVWPGTKMPGHMGNRYRILKGLKIWRINTKYNVLYVSGQNIPGEINSIVTIYDTILPLRQPAEALPFPTFLKTDEDLPEDMFDPEIHVFSDPTIEFKE